METDQQRDHTREQQAMRVETKQLLCGFRAYSALVVPHDWNPKPLNLCGTCGGPVNTWNVGFGHWCPTCKASACDKSCTKVFWNGPQGSSNDGK